MAATAAFLLALAASLVWLLAPLGTAQEALPATPDGEGSTVIRTYRQSLLRVQGWSVAIPLAVPVLVAAPAAALRAAPWRRRIRAASAILLWAWVLLGAASVGLFYLPAAALMLVSWVGDKNDAEVVGGRGP